MKGVPASQVKPFLLDHPYLVRPIAAFYLVTAPVWVGPIMFLLTVENIGYELKYAAQDVRKALRNATRALLGGIEGDR